MNSKTPQDFSFIRLRDTRKVKDQSAAYSRTVNLLRWILPLVVFIVLLALVIWPTVSVKKISSVATNTAPNLVIENLQFTGLDAKNQPYSITASRVLQTSGSLNLVDLEKPQGDIQLENGTWIAGKAQQGRFDQENRYLWLSGDVQIFHDQGYQFSTSEAQIDLGQSAAWGKKPVLLQGPFGEIRGQGFRVADKGNTVVIEGPASVLLNLQNLKRSDKPSLAKSRGAN